MIGLAERLDMIEALLRSSHPTPLAPVPSGEVLWTAEDIARHLSVSQRTVGEKYAPLPGFPRPVRLGGGVRRWYMEEVLEWVASTRQPKPRK